MTLFQRILLIPCLLPLGAVLVLSAFHRGEPTRLYLLGWSSPEAPLGVWTALSATGAAALAATTALLIVPTQQPLRRRLHRSYEPPQPSNWQQDDAHQRDPVAAPPQRDLRDPAPTVAVSYRVIKRGVPDQGSSQSTDLESVPTVRKEVSRTVSERIAQDSIDNQASDWGDDPNRDW